jgi:glycosyltransferase involved in cell wall biosynthesis
LAREKIFSLFLFKKLKRERWDIIFCEDVFSLNVVAMVLRRMGLSLPIILRIHGYPLQEYSSNYSLDLHPVVSRFILNQEQKAYSNASWIIAVDKRIKEYVLSISNRNNSSVSVVRNFANTDHFKPIDIDSKKELKKKMGFSDQDFVVFCPRRLVPKNGVIYAVRAMKFILKKNPETLLLIAGCGPQQKVISSIINKEDIRKNVIMLGEIPYKDIKHYYWISDVVLIPSIPDKNVEEATSNSAIEAMVSGIPVIASNIGGLKEIIVNHDVGSLVPPKDPGSIAQAILFLKENPIQIKKIRNNAINFIIKNYSREKAAKEIELICRNLTN